MVAAKVVNDLSMLVTFSMGKTRLFDASPLLEMPVFAPWKRARPFRALRLFTKSCAGRTGRSIYLRRRCTS